MIDVPTIESCPTVDANGEPVSWVKQELTGLQTWIRQRVKEFALAGPGPNGAQSRIACWHAVPGRPSQDAVGVALQAKFLEGSGAYTEGAYYLRVVGTETRYFTCEAVGAATRGAGVDGYRAEIVALQQTVSTLQAKITEDAGRHRDLTVDYDRVRRERDDLERSEGRLKDKVTSLEAGLKAAEELEKPWIDNTMAEGALMALHHGASGGFEKPAQLLSALVNATVELFQGLYDARVRDGEIVSGPLWPRLMRDGIGPIRVFAVKFNQISAGSFVRSPKGNPLTLRLPEPEEPAPAVKPAAKKSNGGARTSGAGARR